MIGLSSIGSSMAILCVSAAPASAATVRSLLRDGIVGTIAPQGWLALILAYSVSIAMWGLLSTVLVRQLAFWIRRSTAIPAVLGIATSVGLYVIAWGVPSGWEWIWAVVLNLWQGAGTVHGSGRSQEIACCAARPCPGARLTNFGGLRIHARRRGPASHAVQSLSTKVLRAGAPLLSRAGNSASD